MKWSDLSTSPAAGTVVAKAADVQGAVTMTINTAAGDFPLLLVRIGGEIRGYVNMCPHQYLPLDYRSAQVLSADGTKLMCSAHGAMFDAHTGAGIGGEGLGCTLVPVPLADMSGEIRIAG
ncbi:(2Fe-2S)-binding protein [Pseudohoeflea suaedae]|uniref:(2Fe-2S)-binding protein n=1 Tax=Pseudohoeflea suaedae TaxID=877384 RepID=A0A4R5PJ46_9HYPH|nr:Rieske 2Fe-2S domain-containing protein [Pseudohoeflea suaedae]TDH35202.1 (2Fe-2S)-binding protein [Pseudohoeflea suaedae]